MLLDKYKLSRVDILRNKGFYIEDFETWEEANNYSKHTNRTAINKNLDIDVQIFFCTRVTNARKQRWMVKIEIVGEKNEY